MFTLEGSHRVVDLDLETFSLLESWSALSYRQGVSSSGVNVTYYRTLYIIAQNTNPGSANNVVFAAQLQNPNHPQQIILRSHIKRINRREFLGLFLDELRNDQLLVESVHHSRRSGKVGG